MREIGGVEVVSRVVERQRRNGVGGLGRLARVVRQIRRVIFPIENDCVRRRFESVSERDGAQCRREHHHGGACDEIASRGGTVGRTKVLRHNGLVLRHNGLVLRHNGLVLRHKGIGLCRNGLGLCRNGLGLCRNGLGLCRNGLVRRSVP